MIGPSPQAESVGREGWWLYLVYTCGRGSFTLVIEGAGTSNALTKGVFVALPVCRLEKVVIDACLEAPPYACDNAGGLVVSRC